MLPSSFKLLILPFNFIFKRCVYLMKSQGEYIFMLSFHPAPFLVLCFEIAVIPTPFSVPRCTPSPLQQFWGLWCTVLQTSAGFQLATEQDTAPSVPGSSRVPVAFSNTLFRFAWWTEWQIKRKKPHILSIFLFFFLVNHGHKLLL